jgi:ubiquinone/menaquinone biosynthesis C-methylase UbiE
MVEDQEARYDRIADGYARHWGPVIRPAAIRVLDDVASAVPSGPARLVDIGTGTGALALAALERWPAARVTGIDASSEMIAWARAEAERRLPPAQSGRFETAIAVADRLPFADHAFDLAMSSFVFQLVPNRSAALREAYRVLRPGGTLGYVTWLRGSGELDPPDRVFEDVLDEFGFDPPEADDPLRDPASARAVADGMRRAGFRAVHARTDVLVHRWTPRRYIDFLEGFAEESLFAELTERERRSLRHRLRQRLEALPQRDLRLRYPIVYVTGRTG